MSSAIFAIVFLILFALVLLLTGFGLRFLELQRKRSVAATLKGERLEQESVETNILDDGQEEAPKTVGLSQLPFYGALETRLQQAGLNWSPVSLLVAMAVGAFAGALLGFRVQVPIFREFSILAGACLLGSLPYLYVLRAGSKRLRQLEEQFPEVLDFLARSMRAGHAFSVSLEMMAEESPDPVGAEFRKVSRELNLGSPIEVALNSLAQRVPLLDVRFFVSAVLLQRETGGNLAEILTKLAYVIRERFRLKGQVRAASAHGRLTAIILSVMPIITMLALMVVAPAYLPSMAADKDGRYLIIGALMGQLLGYLWMRKIINIKV
jgi:tight adherence protein B